jgi:ATP-dependent HslUV protease subunit HslV
MTTIAYQNGVMAGDSQANYNDTQVGRLTKVIKVNGMLAGAAGDLQDVQIFFDWVTHGMHDTNKPEELNFVGMVVTKTGKVLQFDKKVVAFEIEAPFHAIGSGREFAIGAMEAGASAYQAVVAAAKYDNSTGGEIIVESLL